MKTIRELPKRFFSSCILKSGLSFAPKLSPLPPKTPLAAAIRFQCYRPYKTTLVQNRTARMYDRPPGLSPRVSYNQSQLPRSRQRAEPLRRHLPELVGEARPAILRIPCSIKHMRAIPGRRDHWRSACPYKNIASWATMLRICYSQQWTLCGQLAGPWVQELRSCWQRARRAAAASSAVVDLSDVTFVDENGERLLAEMRSRGVEFIATGVETKHLLQNLKGRGERPLRRSIGSLSRVATPCSSGPPGVRRLRPPAGAAKKLIRRVDLADPRST